MDNNNNDDKIDMKDFWGNELSIGDRVVFAAEAYGIGIHLREGVVIGRTPKKVKVMQDDDSRDKHAWLWNVLITPNKIYKR